jgi:transketolase
MNISQLYKTAYQIRKNVVEAIGPGHRGHFGGSLSSADLMAALYFYKMKHDPANPKKADRDRFVLSKGHASPVLYATLAEAGYFPKSDLKTLKNLGSHLQGHPDVLKTPGVEANTGSLGQGLSIACGMAIAFKMDQLQSRVYVILGDGELGEGQVWEALLFAPARKLDNLVAIIDHNKIQAMGPTCERMNTGNLAEKWTAMGWHVIEIDGHNMEEIVTALDVAETIKGKPTAIVAHTIKGKGISFAENTAAFHNNEFTPNQYSLAIAELDAEIDKYPESKTRSKS